MAQMFATLIIDGWRWIACLVLALLSIEVAYRIYTFLVQEEIFPFENVAKRQESVDFQGFPPLWKFDQEVGWRYRPSGYIVGQIRNGAFTSCQIITHFNSSGNIGFRSQRPDIAQVRGVLVGGSYTMGIDQHTRFLHESMEDRLGKRLGRQVVMENASRARYGLIQMFDMAALAVREHRPHFLIIVFDDAAISFPRRWRFIKPVGEGFFELHALDAPHPEDQNADNSDLFPVVISERVTSDWCGQMSLGVLAKDAEMARFNPLVLSIIEKWRSVNGRETVLLGQIDFATLSRSFLYNRLVFHDAFRGTRSLGGRQKARQTLAVDDFSDDPRFVEALHALSTSSIPYALVRIPSQSDQTDDAPAGARGDGIRKTKDKALVDSLVRATGKEIIDIRPILDGVGKESSDPPPSSSRDDWRTTPYGTNRLSRALSEIVLRFRLAGPATN